MFWSIFVRLVLFRDWLRRIWAKRFIRKHCLWYWHFELDAWWRLSRRTRVLVTRLLETKARAAAKQESCSCCLYGVITILQNLECCGSHLLYPNNLERVVLAGIREEHLSYHAADIEQIFGGNIPESIIRRGSNNEEFLEKLRKKGVNVPSDILDPLCKKAAAKGDLSKLQLLCGPDVPVDLMRTCMQSALGKYPTVALECARILQDYSVIARVLAVHGKPKEMLIAVLYQKGQVPASELGSE